MIFLWDYTMHFLANSNYCMVRAFPYMVHHVGFSLQYTADALFIALHNYFHVHYKLTIIGWDLWNKLETFCL